MAFQMRPEQVAAFDEARTRGFDDYIVEHFKSFTPIHFEAMGEPAVRELAFDSQARAKKYGFTKRGPVRLFAELIILLGYRFDTDPQYPWVAELLNGNGDEDQFVRADRLWAKLTDFLSAIRGPQRNYVCDAIKRCQTLTLESIINADGDYKEVLFQEMKTSFPQKAEYIGDECLRRVITSAETQTEKYELVSEAGVCLFTGCIFAMGHGFAEDPKNPWVAKTLRNQKSKSPDETIQRLYSKLMVYLDGMLTNLEAGKF